jgi:hypothetical protein
VRSVITHFYNEEYLLPWWLRHHRELFDHGVLIDHGSTDASIDICRELAPEWQIVRSRHIQFDAFLTDHEVMTYELDLAGWKIVLTVTEFLLPARPLAEVEREAADAGRQGFTVTGMTVIDTDPENAPDRDVSLPAQKHWGTNDNALPVDVREKHMLSGRNRFYHRAPVGMYHPGRHHSWHPDWNHRSEDVFSLHYGYAPWTEAGIERKLQIAPTLVPEQPKWGWGWQHLRSRSEWEQARTEILPLATDLAMVPGVRRAIEDSINRWGRASQAGPPKLGDEPTRRQRTLRSAAGNIGRRLRLKRTSSADVATIAGSTLFDDAWYASQIHREPFGTRDEAAAHYLGQDGRRRVDPGPRFSCAAYLQRYPDVAASGTDALLHYERHGRAEGRTASIGAVAPEPE